MPRWNAMGKNYMGIASDSQPLRTVRILQCPCQSEFQNSKVDMEYTNINSMWKSRKG